MCLSQLYEKWSIIALFYIFLFTLSPRLFEKAEVAHEELGERLPVLHRAKTAGFVRRGLAELSQGYECLDASRPWLVYWLLHSLELLEETITEEEKDDIVAFLSLCQVIMACLKPL